MLDGNEDCPCLNTDVWLWEAGGSCGLYIREKFLNINAYPPLPSPRPSSFPRPVNFWTTFCEGCSNDTRGIPHPKRRGGGEIAVDRGRPRVVCCKILCTYRAPARLSHQLTLPRLIYLLVGQINDHRPELFCKKQIYIYIYKIATSTYYYSTQPRPAYNT